MVGVGSLEDTHLCGTRWARLIAALGVLAPSCYFYDTLHQPLQPHGPARSYPHLRLHQRLPRRGRGDFPLLPHRRMETVQQNWPTRMGRAHPLLQPVHLHPNRQASRLVDAPLLLKLDPGGWIARGAGDQHHGHPALGQSVWEVDRVWRGAHFVGLHFLADPGLWTRRLRRGTLGRRWRLPTAGLTASPRCSAAKAKESALDGARFFLSNDISNRQKRT